MSSMFSIGADPEVFVKKNGKPISAYGLVKGTKKEPFKTELGAYQVDGMALEFNIDPAPIEDFNRFNLNIVRTVAAMKEAAGDVNLSVTPVQEFDEEYLAAQPDEAKELGCDPDYCAYTMEANPRPDGTRNFRTGAGHIHIGWGADIPVDNEEHMEICANIIKYLDLTVGMLMTYIDRDPRRRELYGKAGAFRPKPYGVEYRTPSNVWIKNRDRRWLVHTMVNKAIGYCRQNMTVSHISGTAIGDWEGVERVINSGDYVTADFVVDRILRHDKTWQNVRKLGKAGVHTHE